MAGKTTDTKRRLSEAARAEFLQYGYPGASLARISASVGISTPSMYNHYSGKAELFAAIVDPIIDMVKATFKDADEARSLQSSGSASVELPDKRATMNHVLDFAYEHLDDVKLLLFCAEGTPYADILDRAAEAEASATVKVLNASGIGLSEEDKANITMIMRFQYRAYAEALRLNWSKERTKAYWHYVSRFYDAGWKQLLHL